MKPLNSKQNGCDPVSSNCVIWQGPDLPCINLCKGDSITTVVAALAEQLCSLIDQFDITTYDLSCLNLCPAPKNIHDLIQIIITRLCAVEACCDDVTPAAAISGCPDCVVNIAANFYYRNPQGDVVTTMQLKDYATAIGNRVSSMVDQITTINSTLSDHQSRIKALEDAPEPTVSIPQITPVCVLPSIPTDIDIVTAALEAQFCELRIATGIPNEIFQGIGRMCAGLTADTRLSPGGGAMSSIPGWIPTVQNLAGAFGNMWLTMCDLRAAVKNIQANCCPSGCNDVAIEVQAVLTGPNTMVLYFTGIIPTGFVQCTSNTLITVTDADGGSISFTVQLSSVMNDPTGFPVNLSGTPLNPSLDFTISSNTCLRNDALGVICERYIQYTLANSLTCPTVSLTPGSNTVTFSFEHLFGTITYIASLYDATGTMLIASQTIPATTAQTIIGSFLSLTGSTGYKFQLSMTSGSASSTCSFQTVTTQPDVCPPPTEVTAILTIP